jgi:hypothetical protein
MQSMEVPKRCIVECWASSVGGCSSGHSREHYISKGIFEDEQITAFGLPWCSAAPVTLGLNSAVAKIRCQRHNSFLSPYDEEASRLSRFLTENVLDRPDANESVVISGARFEKWALKTMLNLWYLGSLDMGKRVDLPAKFVEALFIGRGLQARLQALAQSLSTYRTVRGIATGLWQATQLA